MYFFICATLLISISIIIKVIRDDISEDPIPFFGDWFRFSRDTAGAFNHFGRTCLLGFQKLYVRPVLHLSLLSFYILAVSLPFLFLFEIVFLNSGFSINFIKCFQNFFISIPEAPMVKHNIQLCVNEIPVDKYDDITYISKVRECISKFKK